MSSADSAAAGPVDPAAAGPTWVTVPDIAEVLDVLVTTVRDLINERQLLAARTDGVLRIPAEFVQPGVVVKGLPGTITLLADGGYDDAEIITWLFRSDDSLPGRPIDALRENRGTEVKRRAQSAGF